MLKVAIFIFPDIETLDFCGPLEVFSAANIATGKDHFEIFTFAEKPGPILTINGLSVNPDYDLETMPGADILVLPGGSGSRKVIEKTALLDSLNRIIEKSQYTFSVCSGARILAIQGWLEGIEFTTHHLVFGDVQHLAPGATARPDLRFTDNGKILTSAGVSAGIDLSLHLVEKILGSEPARLAARYMEYDFKKP